jgi:hypothetical protein
MSNLNDLDVHSAYLPEGFPPAPDREPDAERREIILKFEQSFAGLEPRIENRPPPFTLSMHIEFPDDTVSVLPQPDPHDVRLPVQLRGRREPELASKPSVEAKAAGGMPEQNVEVDIDEAIAILLDAEARGKAAAAREAADEDDDAENPLSSARNPANPGSKPVTEPPITTKLAEPTVTAKLAGTAATASSPDWSEKSRTLWSMALIAGSVALVIGTGVGYVMGRGHEATPTIAKIQSSPEGGAKLRADYDLRKR